jgi:SM-20-related protein
MLNLEVLDTAPVVRDPFTYLIAEHAVCDDARERLGRDFPRIARTGSFPLSELSYGPSFAELIEDLRGAALRSTLSARLGVDLGPYPVMVTVRGRIGAHDGGAHTDAAWKIVTVLLYLNDTWTDQGGRLRLLRDKNVEHSIVEIAPAWGTLLAFVRSDHSWHGHLPAEGERRAVQVNWVTSQQKADAEVARHRRSGWIKRLFGRNPY